MYTRERTATARAVAGMLHSEPTTDAQVDAVLQWLNDAGRIDEAGDLVRQAKGAWSQGRPSPATAAWTSAHDAARFERAMTLLLALADDVRNGLGIGGVA